MELSADGVVVVTQRRSNDSLYHALRGDPQALAAEDIQALHRIGYSGSLAVEHVPKYHDPTDEIRLSLGRLRGWLAAQAASHSTARR